MLNQGISADKLPDEDIYQEIRLVIMSKLSSPVEFKDDDNLIELGLDSLKIMGLVSQLRKKGYLITFAEFMERPRLKDWFILMENKKFIKKSGNKEVANQIKKGEAFPLTDVQYAYWVGRGDDQPLGGVGCHAYIELDGKDLEPDRLGTAWEKINKHHPMLRAVFTSDGKQKISPVQTNNPLKINDLRYETNTDKELESIRNRLSHRRFNIENGEVAGIELSLLPGGNTRIHFDIDLLVADVLSLNIVLRDLGLAYLGKSDLPSPKDWDFSKYLNEQSSQTELDKKRAEKYWKEKLDNLGGAPSLPLRVKPESVKTPYFKRRSFFLNKDGWENLKKSAAINRVTPAMVMLAAYAEILDRWSSNSKFLINIPLFDRQTGEKGIQDVVADFTNLLLFSVDCSKEENFIKRVKSLQSGFHKDAANSSYSGIQVQRDLARINKGEHMYAPVVFASNIGSDFISEECLNILGRLEYMISQTPQVWLDFQLYEIDEGLLLTWDSIDELFPENLIRQMFQSFSGLIEELSSSEGDWNFIPDLLPPSQKKRRGRDLDFNIPEIKENIHSPFFDFAKDNHDKTALMDSGREIKITYGDLREYALQIAGFLKKNGVDAGTPVGVMLKRGIPQIAAVLGIVAAGGAYVPINIDQPLDRCSHIFEKASMAHLITDGKRKNRLNLFKEIEIFDIEGIPLSAPLKEPVHVSANDTAYIIFTSGSTGKPKGVEITHGAALNTIKEINLKYEVGDSDIALALSSLEFDLSVYDIFGILGSGGSLVLISEERKRDADFWFQLIDQYKISIWNSVPAFLEMLILFAETEGLGNLSLRLVILSGDWIGLDLPSRLENLTKNCRLTAMGGATEASIWSNYIDVKTPLPGEWKSIPYGRPLPNQVYRVMDDKGRDCPDRVSGELWIGGAGVAKGYRGDKELTEKHFIEKDGMNWFKTGDLGRIWPDDNIEFLGREDFQVKIMGHRIELGEIEEVLRLDPLVKDAIASAVEDESGNKHLVGYVVREDSPGDSAPDYFEEFGENENIISDPVERLEFKMKKPGLRKRNDQAPHIKIPVKIRGKELISSYSKRLSYREFEDQIIETDDFFEFLSTLSAIEVPEYPFPKYRYGSAGGLYPVQVYIHVKPERIGRMEGGLYYYNPVDNGLELISSHNIDDSIVRGSNRKIFEESAFSIFLVADFDAVTPVYGNRSRDFCLIEAGLIAQLLETSCFLHQIGLCQIGMIDFSKIEQMFKLKNSHECLLTLFGGKIIQEDGWTFIDEASENYVEKIKKEDSKDIFLNRLRENTEKKLPSYMVPSFFLLLDELPLSSNGKIDRKSLPGPEGIFKKINDDLVSPETETEKSLARIWQEVLGKKNIGIKDNFFELGGDSLLAVQLILKIRKRFNLELAIGKLFEHTEIKSLAIYIDEISGKDHHGIAGTVELPEIVFDEKSRFEPFPLTDIQQAYWIGRKGDFELGNVSTHFYIELDSMDLDIDALNLAWNKVINRHEMLRAVVLPDGRQKILEDVLEYSFSIMDMRGKSREEIESALNLIREELSHQVLSSEKWPLFDIRLSTFQSGMFRIHISFDAQMVDAWSFFSLISDWYLYYVGSEDLLNPIELSFRDYVFAEKEIIGSRFYERDKKYWLKRLETLPLAPELPLIKNPSRIKEPRFVRRSFSMEAGDWNRLKGFAAKRDITPAVLLITAYANILSLWSKNPEFSINLTLFNRLPMHTQVNEIVGDFTSLTLLEVDGSSYDEKFTARALKLQKQLWQDLDHRYFSGVEVLREMARQNGEFKRSSMPVVFTSALNVDSLGRNISGFNKFGKWVYGVSQTPQVWLDQQVYEQDGELILIWDAVEDIFPPGLLDDMFHAYEEILKALCKDEEKWNEPCIPEIPHYQLVKRREVNNTDKGFSSQMLHSGFHDNYEKFPDNTAVISNGKKITYLELYNLSASLADLLTDNNAGQASLVAVAMEKGCEQVVAVLGILYSGAAYLPIDPSLPKSRRFHLLKEAGVEIVLTQSWLGKELEWPENLSLFSVDLFSDKNRKIKNRVPSENPDDLAYVIYTSGSTGLPKGVMIDHKAAVNTIDDINKKFNITHKDSILALSQLNFDLSVYDIFGILGKGGTIIIPDADKTRDPAHWLDLIKSEKVSIWNTVPALMQMLLEYISGTGEEAEESLRMVLLSGDWIPLDMPDKIRSCFKNSGVIGLGGATEASIWSNIYEVDEVDKNWKSIPYGKPMANQRYYVLNKWMKDCPDRVPGQLYIGGRGLAKGYLNDEDKTAKSFVIHPDTGERIYKTGDLACYWPDGNIEFLGREDFQIKINGYRVELGEVEAALNDYRKVKRSVANLVKDNRGNKFIAAYIVLEKGEAGFSKEDLDEFLKQRLPSYMVPSFYMKIGSLPMTSNGKIDRKNLPEIDEIIIDKKREYLAPENKLEEKIALILQDITGVEKVSINDSFFDLGANSMDLVLIQTRIKKDMGKKLNIVDFFEHPTIRSLADYLTRKKKDNSFKDKADKRAGLRNSRRGRRFNPASE